jgi:UDP-N-acetylglucosamine 3-dehydrogenase
MTIQKRIKIAMIGAGTHATNELFPSLNFINGIERVAVCDLKEDLAINIAKKFGFSKLYTNYEEMLEKEDLDGVIVCINAKAHPKVVEDCLNHEVDVLVEKPASIFPKESEKLFNLANKKKRFVMVEHQKRRASAYLKMMEIIKRKEFGEVVMIESKQHGYSYDSLFDCLIELQIHNIDILRAFGGEIKCIKAIQKKISDSRAAIALLLEFENGIIGTTHIGTEGNRGAYCERLEVVGSNGRGVFVENVRKLTYYEGNKAETWQADWMPFVRNSTLVLDGYIGNIKHFVECIRSRENPTPNIYDEMKTLEVIFDICEQLKIKPEWSVVVGER